MTDLDEIDNMLEFLIKENLRLTKRIINLNSVLSDHLSFTKEEENSVMNPQIDYEEENRIIRKLHYKSEGGLHWVTGYIDM